MENTGAAERSRHNQDQRNYFGRTVKRTMMPVNSRYLNRQVDEMLDFVPIPDGGRVLEVGCGMGRYTLLLAARGLRVEGLDLSSFLLDHLREFDDGRYDIPLYCADVVNYPPELAGRYDAILGFFTLHHLHDLELCFEAMAGMLKPGGRLAFLEPNPYNISYYAQMLITPGMTWRGDGGLVRLRPRRVFRAMRLAGLTRPGMARFGVFPPYLANQNWGSRLEDVLERVPLWRSLLAFQMFRGERQQ